MHARVLTWVLLDCAPPPPSQQVPPIACGTVSQRLCLDRVLCWISLCPLLHSELLQHTLQLLTPHETAWPCPRPLLPSRGPSWGQQLLLFGLHCLAWRPVHHICLALAGQLWLRVASLVVTDRTVCAGTLLQHFLAQLCAGVYYVWGALRGVRCTDIFITTVCVRV
jgi:hypothetical protein